MKNLTMIPSIGEALNPAQTLPALMLDHGSDEDAVAVEICDACFAQPDSSAKSNNFNSDPIPQRAWRLTAVLILVAFAVLSVASARAQPLRNYRLPGNVGIRMTASLASAGQIDDQLDKFIEIIGDLKGNATICNVEKSQHALLYEETINNAELIAGARYRQLGLNENLAEARERKAYQKVKIAHQANLSTPDCRSFGLQQISALDRPMARQAVEFLRRSYQKSSGSPDGSDRLPPNATNDDLQAIPFAGLVGSLKGDAEICKTPSQEYIDVVQAAEIVVKARYRQIGLNENSENCDEDGGYKEAFIRHKDYPQMPICESIENQVKNVEKWTARQGAEYIRKLASIK